MKTILVPLPLFLISLLTLVGCTPKNPPSEASPVTSVSSESSREGLMGCRVPVPDRFESRGETMRAYWTDIDPLPPAAIVAVVHFDFDRYDVSPAERGKLDQHLKAIQGRKIVLAGYSDRFGTAEYNLGLSDKRAHAVEALLRKLGAGETDVRAFGSQYAKKTGSKDEVADDRRVILIDPSRL